MIALAVWISLAALAPEMEFPAPAPHRTAVLIVAAAATDAELADNVTEIAISWLAGRGRGEFVGTREFRRRLERSGSEDDLIRCCQEISCLRRTLDDLAIRRFVTGILLRQDGGVVIALSLTDAASGAIERSLRVTSADAAGSLIRAVRDGIAGLFDARPAPVDLQLRRPTPGPAAEVVRPGAETPRRWRWGVPLAYGSGALAVASFAGAGILGTLATAEPSGSTRADAQRDLQQRHVYATNANILWIAGGALLALSAAAFVWLRRE
jgi:hypothetical protein